MDESVDLLERDLVGVDWTSVRSPGDGLSAIRAYQLASADDPVLDRLGALAQILDLRFTHRNGAECPFRPEQMVAALDKVALAKLASCVVTRQLPSAIQARVLDVAWYRRACAFGAVALAVREYMKSATELVETDPNSAVQYLTRAVSLSASVGRKSTKHVEVLSEVASITLTIGTEPSRYAVGKLMRLLQEQRYEDPEPLAVKADAIATEAAARADFGLAVTYLELKGDWYRDVKDTERRRLVEVEIAEIRENGARHFEAVGNLMAAVQQQMEALVAWRHLGEAERAKEAQRKLHCLQQAAANLFEHEEFEVDLTRCVESALQRVSGKSPREALVGLATLVQVPSLTKLKERVRARMGEFVFFALAERVAVRPNGRVAHISEPTVVADDGGEAAVLDEARGEYVHLAGTVAWGGIVPAVERVQLEHGLNTRALMGLVEKSRFVPAGRAWSFAHGLALGFNGQFVTAAHLLMPQFENAVRVIAEARGAVVANFLDSGVQNEADLGKLLSLPETKAFFGEDEHFMLESLLVERAGGNLRNELAHGLFDDHSKDSLLIYFWWTVFRYVVAFTGILRSSAADDATEQDESAEP